MEKVFIYRDNSDIFFSAPQVAVEHEGEAVRYRARIHFQNAPYPVRHAVPIERGGRP